MLPREIVDVPSLEVLKFRLDETLSNYVLEGILVNDKVVGTK